MSVGNSRIKLGVASGTAVDDCRSIANAEFADAVEQIGRLSAGGAPVVLASVNDPVADRVEKLLTPLVDAGIYRIGRDLRVPIALALADAATVGQDRLLNALGAFGRAKQACVVIDAGTAVTVDFVDGEGTFQGGVIAPGLRMMLHAMHQRTAALPELEFSVPDAARGPFGKDTAHAMLLGVVNALRGLVRHTVEQYAEAYGAYPQVVATGGDSRALFEDDPVVEHLVPDLQLVGLAVACDLTLGAEAGEDREDE